MQTPVELWRNVCTLWPLQKGPIRAKAWNHTSLACYHLMLIRSVKEVSRGEPKRACHCIIIFKKVIGLASARSVPVACKFRAF